MEVLRSGTHKEVGIMSKHTGRHVALILSSVVALAGLATSGALAASGDRTTFSGQATVVRATVLGNTTVLSDTGPLPESGGALEASLLEAEVPGLLTAEVLHASTVGQGNESNAEASVANVGLTVGGNTIAADFLAARARAACGPTGPTTSGSSEIVGLVINGQPIVVSGEPNQTIDLPLGTGKVVINEQSSARPGDITVNALHVVVNGVADVVISSAHADVNCKPTCNQRVGDFVTGGGWITGTPSGSRGNFGVAGGLKNGSLWGHLVYNDHGSGGPKVKGTGVTAYSGSGNARHIEGTATVNGKSGFTYAVDVTDNGEPGRDDTFSLRLSSGYTASGKLAGGNIQLHKPKNPCP
jgi:hypothetical protein